MATSLDPAQVRAHWFRSHGLVQPAADLPALLDALVALHHTDPATARISALCRLRQGHVDRVHEAFDRALTDDRSMVRVIAMRNTLFAIATEELPWFDAATRVGLARAVDRGITRLLTRSGLCAEDDAMRCLRRIEAKVIDALGTEARTSTELAEQVPELGAIFEPPETDNWAKPFAIGGRLLNALAIVGGILRGPPAGSWRSSQFKWVAQDAWLGGPLPEVPADEAMAHVIRRYLAAFGPVTLDDVVWWTGWTKTACRTALMAIDPVTVTVDGWPFERLVLRESVDRIGDAAPLPADHVAFLPGLDPFPMGTKQREHWLRREWSKDLFDRSGNVGPTVWLAGELVGGWAHQGDGKVAWELVTGLDGHERALVQAEADRLGEALGPDQVRFRFVAPIEKRNR